MCFNVNREHGNKVLGEVTLDQAYGGARGVKCLVWEVCTYWQQTMGGNPANYWLGFRFGLWRRHSFQRQDRMYYCNPFAWVRPKLIILQIPEIQKLLPKAPGGEEPLPEGIWSFKISSVCHVELIVYRSFLAALDWWNSLRAASPWSVCRMGRSLGRPQVHRGAPRPLP